MQRSHRIWAVALLAMALAGCGGGGSSSGDSGFTPPTDSFDVGAAWRNVLATTQTWTVSGIATDGYSYTESFAVAPGPTSIFPVTGASLSRSDVTLSLGLTGGTLTTQLNQVYFDAVTHLVAGTRISAGSVTVCSVATAASVPPSAALVGASGSLLSLDELDGCLATSPKVGTSTSTWSLEFEAGITYFCMNATVRNTTGAVVATESDCLQVSPSGALGARARITVSQNGVTLVARN